jgi:molecular chaperone IbpA
MDNGLLVVDLKRELPEALKPRRIEIGKGQTQARIETVSKTAA